MLVNSLATAVNVVLAILLTTTNVWCVVSIVRVLKWKSVLPWGMAATIPVFGLITILVVKLRAEATLKKNGIHVGFLITRVPKRPPTWWKPGGNFYKRTETDESLSKASKFNTIITWIMLVPVLLVVLAVAQVKIPTMISVATLYIGAGAWLYVGVRALFTGVFTGLRGRQRRRPILYRLIGFLVFFVGYCLMALWYSTMTEASPDRSYGSAPIIMPTVCSRQLNDGGFVGN